MSLEDKLKQSFLDKSIFILAGAALLFGGILIINNILANIKDGAAYLFIFFLPAPMVVFGICAMYAGLRHDKPTQVNNTFTESLSNTIEAESSHNDSSNPKQDKLQTNIFQPQVNDNVGSHLATLFFIFGTIIMLIVLVGSTVIDINNGVTEVCGRRNSCHKAYLEDSELGFYISLVLGKIYFIIFTVFLGIFAFKRLNE